MSIPPHAPSSSDENRFSDGPPLPRWVFWLMLPGLVAPLLIFAFIFVTERAHDARQCPFHELSRRSLAPQLLLVEEQRRCIGEVEEHRYSILRGGTRRLIGERRFDAPAFALAHYRVDAQITAAGEVQLVIHNDGHDDVLFREGTDRERKSGVSREHRSAAHPGERN
jgi:hypothetical protein